MSTIDFTDDEDGLHDVKDRNYIEFIKKYKQYSIEQLERMIEIGKNVIASTEITLNNPLTKKLDDLLDTNIEINNTLQCITNNSVKKGAMGENIIYNHLRCILPTHCVKMVSKNKNQADIHIRFRGRLIIIDTKCYKQSVPSEEIEKLKKDALTTKCSMAFLISLTSDISTIEESIQMEKIGDQSFVYMSNIEIDKTIGLLLGLINYNDLIRNIIEDSENKKTPEVREMTKIINNVITGVNKSVNNYNIINKHISNLEKGINDMSKDFNKCQETLANDIKLFNESIQDYCIVKDVYKKFDNMSDEEKVEFYYGSYIYTSLTKTYRMLLIRIGNYICDNNFDIKIEKNDDCFELNIYKNGKFICKTETKNTNQFKCHFIFNDQKIQLLSTKIDLIFDELLKAKGCD